MAPNANSHANTTTMRNCSETTSSTSACCSTTSSSSSSSSVHVLETRKASIDTTPYAIDVEVSHKGRRFASTKRRVKFRFGFGHLSAMTEGRPAAQCRGEEHEVVLVWSLTSGKQRVLADGVEVHFSRQSVTGKFHCEWTMKSGHAVKVTSAWAPLNKDVRQFDLRIDGLSYWKMPQIFQLGSPGGSSRARAMPTRRRNSSSTVPMQAQAPTVPLLLSTRHASMPQLMSSDGTEQPQDLLRLDFSSSETFSSSSGRPSPVLRAQSDPIVPADYQSPTSVMNLWDETAGHKVEALMDASWHVPLPRTPMYSHTHTHEPSLSPMEKALKSLVNMEPASCSYSSHQRSLANISPSPSMGDLSVHSAFTPSPAQGYGHGQADANANGLWTPRHSFAMEPSYSERSTRSMFLQPSYVH